MQSVRDWLNGLGLSRYAEAFETNDVDIEVLPSLNEADLEKLGVSLGHRKKILKAVAGSPRTAIAESPVASGEVAPLRIPPPFQRQKTLHPTPRPPKPPANAAN